MPFLKLGQRPLPAGFRLPLAYTSLTLLAKPPKEPEPLPSFRAASEAVRREYLSSQRITTPQGQSADGLSLSFLQQTAVKPGTSRDYRLRTETFCKW